MKLTNMLIAFLAELLVITCAVLVIYKGIQHPNALIGATAVWFSMNLFIAFGWYWNNRWHNFFQSFKGE